jgi:hypothetical protein
VELYYVKIPIIFQSIGSILIRSNNPLNENIAVWCDVSQVEKKIATRFFCNFLVKGMQ